MSHETDAFASDNEVDDFSEETDPDSEDTSAAATHPSLLDPDMEWEWPDINDVPKPTPEDLHAAEILGRLIAYGYVPDPVPELPPVWADAFEAVRDVVHDDRRTRFSAFTEAIAQDPLFALKLNEVNRAMPRTVDRLLQTREAYSADELISAPPQLDWAIPGLFVQPSVNFLVGEPGSKKTFLATDLAACVAMGIPWLGRPVNQTHVLFIDEETGLYQLWGRFAACLKAHAAPWGLPLHAISLGGYDLRDKYDAERLTHRALTYNAHFIVIDALANLMRGAGDGNIAAVQPVLFQLRRLAEIARAAILVLHHTNREGDFRGTSAISAAADLMLQVHSAPDDDLVKVNTIKARFYAPPPFAARADFTPAADASPRVIFHPAEDVASSSAPAPLASRPKTAALLILDQLSQASASRSQLEAQLPQLKAGNLRNVLFQLINSGLVKRQNPGKKGKKAVYSLA
jgi:hypothetical protein